MTPEGGPRDRMLYLVVRTILRLAPEDFRDRHLADLMRVHLDRASAQVGTAERLGFAFREVAGAAAAVARLRVAQAGGGLPGPAEMVGLLRSLLRHPVHLVASVSVLSIGIGLVLAVSATVDAYLLRPLPFADPHRLVTIHETNPDFGWTPEDQVVAAPANVLDWRAEVDAFEEIAMYSDFVSRSVLVDGEDATLLSTLEISGDFFSVLGVEPLLGRFPTREDTWSDGSAPAAVISHGAWTRLYGRDRGVLGRVIDLDGSDGAEIVAVAPPGFSFPTDGLDLWISWNFDRANRTEVWFRRAHFVRPIARLGTSATIQMAEEQLAAVVARLKGAYPETNSVMGAVVVPLRSYLVSGTRSSLWAVSIAAALVFLLAVVNASALALVRAGDGVQDLWVRSALGASRGRLTAGVILENIGLATFAALVGAALAWAGLRVTASVAPLGIDGIRGVSVGVGTLKVALACTVMAVVPMTVTFLFGLRTGSVHASGALSGRGLRSMPHARSRSQGLIATEVALAMTLLVTAGLMVRTLANLGRVEVGFEPDGVVAAEFHLPPDRYPDREEVLGFQNRLLGALADRPQAESAGIVGGLPLAGPGWSSQVRARDWPADRVGWNVVHRRADQGYFETLGIRLLQGRHLDPFADPDGPLEVVVNETFVTDFLPDADPVGVEIGFDAVAPENWFRIVGVVEDQHQTSPGVPPSPEVFEHRSQDWDRTVWVVTRWSGGSVGDRQREMRAVFADVDPKVVPARIQSLSEVRDRALGRERLTGYLLVLFAAGALLLAGAGVYGVTAQLVRRRRHEIGVRMALGAASARVTRMVVRQGMTGVTLGVLVGSLLSLAAARMVQSLLFEVAPGDPATLVSVSLLLILVALAAIWGPALRAARTDPSRSLRSD